MANRQIHELNPLPATTDSVQLAIATSTQDFRASLLQVRNVLNERYDATPTGTMATHGGERLPSGWLYCRGQSLLRADYDDLFNVIGTQWGSADATHFNLPDMRGVFARGWSGGNPSTAIVPATTASYSFAMPSGGTFEIMSASEGSAGMIGLPRHP